MRLPVQELASEAQQQQNLKQRLRLRICIDDDGIGIARQTMYAILCQEEVVAVRYRSKRIQKGKDRNCQLISENVVTAAKANKAGIASSHRERHCRRCLARKPFSPIYEVPVRIRIQLSDGQARTAIML